MFQYQFIAACIPDRPASLEFLRLDTYEMTYPVKETATEDLCHDPSLIQSDGRCSCSVNLDRLAGSHDGLDFPKLGRNPERRGFE